MGAISTHRDSHPPDVAVSITGMACPGVMPVDSNCRHSRVSHATVRLSTGREPSRRCRGISVFIMKVILLPSLGKLSLLLPIEQAGRPPRSPDESDDHSQSRHSEEHSRQRTARFNKMGIVAITNLRASGTENSQNFTSGDRGSDAGLFSRRKPQESEGNLRGGCPIADGEGLGA
jgi:hypothetical protein